MKCVTLDIRKKNFKNRNISLKSDASMEVQKIAVLPMVWSFLAKNTNCGLLRRQRIPQENNKAILQNHSGFA